VKKYYSGKNNGLIGCSVPATEHSVMCMGGKDNEIDTYRRLITKLYPSGIVSIVSDTWDFWSIMTTGIRELHDDIMARDGKVVFRPDSGDPVQIICGDPSARPNTPEWFGAYRLLWNEFGGSNVGGHNILNEKVGLIYGDAITLDRQLEILSKLKEMGFAPNIVLGIGSYSYQYATRDTYGFAMKATYGEVNGESREIFKEPKTDSGEKKSAKGRVAVYENDMGDLQLYDQCTQQQADGGLLKPKFRNGQMISRVSLADIRSRLHPKQF
jgi:nicotinamide phosphoribosyltransferase